MDANQLIAQNSNQAALSKHLAMPAGFIDKWHRHPWHQVIFPRSGLIQSQSDGNQVVLPHNALLFVPANTWHASEAICDTQFLAVYINPSIEVGFPAHAQTCLVTPFLKALILEIVGQIENATAQIIHHLLQVLGDQLATAQAYTIPLLTPKDRRLNAIFTTLIDAPDTPYTLAQWAQQVGASERTLSRLIAKEFQQSFSAWRQHIRLVLSLRLLQSERSVHDIALTLGYTSDSAYICAFKKLFKQTPNQYRKLTLASNL
ncbi:helix-turn-helix transcriptional regulator [Pseudoalteromonas obscura]|uniref:Helix-turn-helix transcriptional regulator n=1 Tax=Pseudoalteromonas obscura TaxID=3048491 RepID=A0ABT7ELK4_9GAMM|nr:helix-turn-helix transcriptional regulator [Pseudoalteromonas sp. P94(2023)]MDK2595931.1 helix-turn-helix transcriptional regulator [Pseudoalteromonas sp. P94(2023)]